VTTVPPALAGTVNRRLVSRETGGTVEVRRDRLLVRFERRSHNPVLREAVLDRDTVPVQWLGTGRSNSQRVSEFAYACTRIDEYPCAEIGSNDQAFDLVRRASIQIRLDSS